MSATHHEDCTQTPPRPSSLLYQDAAATVVVLDIPASLQESQVLSGKPATRRIYSSPAPDAPFDTPEPKQSPAFGFSAGGGGVSGDAAGPAAQIAALMTAETARSAVQHVGDNYAGPLCLPRVVAPGEPTAGKDEVTIPEGAHYLHGSIQDLKREFNDAAPEFDLVVLDPPWPNRSARRKTKGYKTVQTLSGIRSLLQDIPIASHLSPGGLVAVWVTNKPSIVELLTAGRGIFEEWGLQLVTEWTWLKVTATGEPLFDIDSAWRKPWEKLLIARRPGFNQPQVPSKTILAVPDLHSRKPSLRGMFEPILGPEYKGLEVFARNLTAGWWSWGDQVLKFQSAECWEAQ